MKKFQLVLTNWDDNNVWEYEHPDKTEEQFKKDVDTLIRITFNYYIDRQKKYNRLCTHRGAVEFIEAQMISKGYSLPRPYEGSYIVNDIGIFNESKGELNDEFKAIIKENRFKRASDYNKKFQCDLREVK